MVLKIINATEAKQGVNILIDGSAYIIKNVDISKTGKHGSAKCRIEALGILSGQKKILVVPGHERFEVPMVDKRKAQVLSVHDGKVNAMDLENFETIDIPCDPEIIGTLEENSTVEYWDVEGDKIVKRKL